MLSPTCRHACWRGQTDPLPARLNDGLSLPAEMDKPPSLKPLYWVGSPKRDLRSLPGPVEDLFGYALYLVQDGKKHEQAKPLKGFGSAGVLEVVEDWDRST